VPGSADTACIEVVGTYTVTLDGSDGVSALELGGASGTQTLDVDGNAAFGTGMLNLGATSTVNANGVLAMTSSDGSNYSMVNGSGSLTIARGGTLRTIGSGNARYIRVNVTNQAGGTIDIGAAISNMDNGTTTTNNGTVTVESGGHLYLENGTVFAMNGGSETGNPVELLGGVLNDSAGTGGFTFESGSTGDLTGTIPAGQTVSFEGNATDGNTSDDLSGTVTDDGTLALTSPDGGGYPILQPATDTSSLTIGSGGVLETVQGGGNARYIRVNVTNQAGGTIDIGAADSLMDQGNSVTNNGTVTVQSGGHLYLEGGSSFSMDGGSETGNPVELLGGTLNDSAGTGGFTFETSNGNTLAGTIPAGQTVSVDGNETWGNAGASLSGTVTDDGTLDLTSPDGGGFALIQGSPLTVASGGLFETTGTDGQTRYIRVNVTNEAGGTVDLQSPGGLADQGTTFTNSGTFAFADGGDLSLTGGSTFTQTSGGVFDPTVDATTGVSGLSGGTYTLAGELEVTTVGTPTVGNTYQPISGASSVSGTFSMLSFGPHAYAVSYPGTAVTVTVQTPFSAKAGKTIKATEDTPTMTATVATLASLPAPPGSLSATVDWGDGTPTSPGTIKLTGTTGKVTAPTHIYTTPGTYTVTVTIADNNGTTQVVTLKAEVATAPVPTVTSVSPDQVVAGNAKQYKLTLTGTGFTALGESVGVSATGITVESVTFSSATKLIATVKVAASATLGAGNVSVTTPGGTGTCAGCLTVDQPPKPTGVTPPLVPGSATTVSVTGSGFQAGLTVKTSITGATVGTPTNVTPTSFTAKITVPPGTGAGGYTLTVTNPDGGTGKVKGTVS
jgi:hypothetical protein